MQILACALVIFGATGDLAKKKLIPALYRLHLNGELCKTMKIYATGRKDYSDKQIRAEYERTIEKDTYKKSEWRKFSERIHYHRLEFHEEEGYKALGTRLDDHDNKRIFYLATPPTAFPLIAKNLVKTGIARRNPRDGWHRIVFEKPFGSDLQTAQKLNEQITEHFDEKQIYRIDHYVGKSFVQEILALRFGNPMFDQLWNNRHISNIHIMVSETAGVGTRGGYYEHSGALRDMVQNHLLQLLCLTTMEAPISMDAEAMRGEKAQVLKHVVVGSNDVVFGQYSKGKIPAYRSEPGVTKNSKTETFAAVKLGINNDRWRDVPFYLITGKALDEKYAEIVVDFRTPYCRLFQTKDGDCGHNTLVIRIQPDEGVRFVFNLADKAAENLVKQQVMSYCHEAVGLDTAAAYELLLHECISGDQTLFTRWDFVERSWKIVDELRKRSSKIHFYKPGTKGPKEALSMLRERNW